MTRIDGFSSNPPPISRELLERADSVEDTGKGPIQQTAEVKAEWDREGTIKRKITPHPAGDSQKVAQFAGRHLFSKKTSSR